MGDKSKHSGDKSNDQMVSLPADAATAKSSQPEPQCDDITDMSANNDTVVVDSTIAAEHAIELDNEKI